MVLLAMLLSLVMTVPASAEPVTAIWEHDALSVYENGFMSMLMRSTPRLNRGDGGVSLFNMELVQNDAPGAGRSEKGVYSDIIWGKNGGRKILSIDDTRAFKAFIVFWVYKQGKYPLHFKVNDNTVVCENWKKSKSIEVYRWIEFPVEWLRKGRNIIEFFSPEAAAPEEGWEIYIARADEFEAGGGDPADVGKTSFKSSNSGESWKESPFGPLGQTRAEYTVRISLDRFVRAGWLATPVIDLWRGDSDAFIVRQHVLNKLSIQLRSETPEGTTVEYYLRKGGDPSPFSDKWEPYEPIGSGESVDMEIGKAGSEIKWDTVLQGALNRRYIQIRAVLSTTNPLKSPVVKSMRVESGLQEPYPVPLHENIVVLDADNPPIQYSSIDWQWEPWNRPEFEELKARESSDQVITGALSDFDAQVKLLDYATKRWRWTNPQPDYPGWDALSISDRIDNLGGGGMCIQFNLFLGGLCMAYGWQARLVNIVGHEICEVWNDEFAKWIYLDASYVNQYVYDPKTGEPLNLFELHKLYIDYYFPDRPIDWMNDFTGAQNYEGEDKYPVRRASLTTHQADSHNGFTHAAFMRMMPRNNYYEKVTPRPLAHGSSTWPWDGYINWYDDRTPPKRQYTMHTDRPRDMWPDLNRVHIDATQGFGNDRLFLRFETYTPNFSHFEVDVNDHGWKKIDSDHWAWLLGSGRNTLRVRAVSKRGAHGKPSTVVINHADLPLEEYKNK